MPEETNQPITKVKPVKKNRGKKIFFLLLSYIIVGLVVWQIQSQFTNSPERQEELARQEIEKVVEKVGELMLLPVNEFPQMATIDNAPELAKTQAFFSSIENGDKVLIYLQDQKAIIYRPSTHKIINVGPVVAENTQNQQSNRASTQTSTSRATSTSSTNNTSNSRDSDR